MKKPLHVRGRRGPCRQVPTSASTTTPPTVVDAQNDATNAILMQCATRGQFKELFTRLYDFPKFGTPFRRGHRCVVLLLKV